MSKQWPPKREDKFAVGDEVWWNSSVVFDSCRTWCPDVTKPVRVIAVRDSSSANGHSQMVRVSPNYCPFGDEFDGLWFLPTGIKTHNDPAYRDRPDVKTRRDAGYHY